MDAEPTPMPAVIYEHKFSVIEKTVKARKLAKKAEASARARFETVYGCSVMISAAAHDVSVSIVSVRVIGDPKDGQSEGMKRIAKPSGLLSPTGQNLPVMSN